MPRKVRTATLNPTPIGESKERSGWKAMKKAVVKGATTYTHQRKGLSMQSLGSAWTSSTQPPLVTNTEVTPHAHRYFSPSPKKLALPTPSLVWGLAHSLARSRDVPLKSSCTTP
jgi:hypothetical protein